MPKASACSVPNSRLGLRARSDQTDTSSASRKIDRVTHGVPLWVDDRSLEQTKRHAIALCAGFIPAAYLRDRVFNGVPISLDKFARPAIPQDRHVFAFGGNPVALKMNFRRGKRIQPIWGRRGRVPLLQTAGAQCRRLAVPVHDRIRPGRANLLDAEHGADSWLPLPPSTPISPATMQGSIAFKSPCPSHYSGEVPPPGGYRIWICGNRFKS